MLKRIALPLLIFFCGLGFGCASGFFIYSANFPSKVVKVSTIKMKRSPGGIQSVEILDAIEQDTIKVEKKKFFKRIFGRR